MRLNNYKNSLYLFIIIMIFVSCGDENRLDEPVYFADVNLENCIKNMLIKPDNEKLTQYDLEDVDHLFCGGLNIKYLGGLEYMKDLDVLDLAENQIEDLSPLSRLNILETLYLNENMITDISAISELPELNHLSIGKNCIEDISTLVKMEERDITIEGIHTQEPEKCSATPEAF